MTGVDQWLGPERLRVLCYRDGRVVHSEETELAVLRGDELDRLDADGYLSSIATFSVVDRSWLAFESEERYDEIHIQGPGSSFLIELLDDENSLVSATQLDDVYTLICHNEEVVASLAAVDEGGRHDLAWGFARRWKSAAPLPFGEGQLAIRPRPVPQGVEPLGPRSRLAAFAA